MAYIGAQYPRFAPFAAEETDTAMPTYDKTNLVILGELVGANLTVTNASGEQHGDDKLVEKIEQFASGAIPMETTDLSDASATVIYGNEVVDQAIEDKVLDEPPYGGLSYFKTKYRKGKTSYEACFYPKAKAALGNDNAQTKNGSISIQNATTNFTIFPPLCDEGAWRRRQTFETIAEAKTWLDKQYDSTTP